MPLFRRDLFQVWLSILLIVAFAVMGCADQTRAVVSNRKHLQLERDGQFLLSPPALELKSTARKTSASWNLYLVCSAAGQWDFCCALAASRLDGVISARLPLSDLCGLRGRAPPADLLS